MYTIAAIWNWVLAIVFLALPRIDINNFYIAGDTIPPTLLWFDCFMGLVFAFGIGFYLISLDMHANQGLVIIASFEKVWVFIIGFFNFLLGDASIWVAIVVLGDLIFGLLFMENLRATRKM